MSYRHTGMIMCATAVDTAAERTRALRIYPVRSESPLLLKKIEQSLNTASARVHGDTRADDEIECCSTGGSRNQINAVLSTVRESLTELLQAAVSLAFPLLPALPAADSVLSVLLLLLLLLLLSVALCCVLSAELLLALGCVLSAEVLVSWRCVKPPPRTTHSGLSWHFRFCVLADSFLCHLLCPCGQFSLLASLVAAATSGENYRLEPRASCALVR